MVTIGGAVQYMTGSMMYMGEVTMAMGGGVMNMRVVTLTAHG